MKKLTLFQNAVLLIFEREISLRPAWGRGVCLSNPYIAQELGLRRMSTHHNRQLDNLVQRGLLERDLTFPAYDARSRYYVVTHEYFKRILAFEERRAMSPSLPRPYRVYVTETLPGMPEREVTR